MPLSKGLISRKDIVLINYISLPNFISPSDWKSDIQEYLQKLYSYIF